jgi:hypothetical protein
MPGMHTHQLFKANAGKHSVTSEFNIRYFIIIPSTVKVSDHFEDGVEQEKSATSPH